MLFSTRIRSSILTPGLVGMELGRQLYALRAHALDRFRVGVAVAPVTDWLDYDSIYTERYLACRRRMPMVPGVSPCELGGAVEGEPAPRARNRRRQRAHGKHGAVCPES